MKKLNLKEGITFHSIGQDLLLFIWYWKKIRYKIKEDQLLHDLAEGAVQQIDAVGPAELPRFSVA